MSSGTESTPRIGEAVNGKDGASRDVPRDERPSAMLSAVAVSLTRGLMLVLTLASGVLSASYFGTSAAKDCYLVAQALPSLLGTLLLSGIYGIVLVALVEIGPAEGVAGQLRLVRRTLGQLALVLVPLCVAVSFFPRPVIALIAPGFGPEELALSGRLLPLTMFAMLGAVGFAVFRALYNARHQFAMPGFVNLILGLSGIVTLVVLVGRVGIFSLALGQLFGAFLSMAVLGTAAFLLLKDRPGFVPHPTHLTAAGGRSPWRDLLPLSIGANFGQVNLLVNNAFASHLASGSITQLGFASVIFTNAELLTIFALAEVAFQRFTVADRHGPAALEAELQLNLRYMILLSAPIAAGCLVFGTPLARLLFERGEFGPDSTNAVAGLLACLGPEILFMGYFACFWRILFARRRLRLLVWTSLGAMALNVALNSLLVEVFGIRGIALSTTLVTTVFAIVLGILVHREGVRVFGRGDRLFVLQVLGAAAVMGGAVMAWTTWFERMVAMGSQPARLTETAAGLVLAGAVYATALQVQGIRAVPEALGRIARATGLGRRG